MPLISLDTRRKTVTDAAQAVRAVCQQASARYAAGNVPADDLVAVAQSLSGFIQAVSPYSADTALSAYADAQFAGTGWTPGSLLQLINGGIALVGQAVAAAIAAVPTDAGGHLLTRTWATVSGVRDGSTNAVLLSPADTAALRTKLDAVVAAIPE
jgi:hypothetical protein